MEKVSGVEHTEALAEMLQDAKKNGNPIVTTWLDLVMINLTKAEITFKNSDPKRQNNTL